MLIAQVFVMCLGMFVIHTLAASEVNHNARSLGGVVNGLYVSLYYAGGAFGAWLMGYIYELFGWTLFLWSLLQSEQSVLVAYGCMARCIRQTTINRRIFVVFPALNFEKKGSVIGLFTDPFVNIVKYKLCGTFHADIR